MTTTAVEMCVLLHQLRPRYELYKLIYATRNYSPFPRSHSALATRCSETMCPHLAHVITVEPVVDEGGVDSAMIVPRFIMIYIFN